MGCRNRTAKSQFCLLFHLLVHFVYYFVCFGLVFLMFSSLLANTLKIKYLSMDRRVFIILTCIGYCFVRFGVIL